MNKTDNKTVAMMQPSFLPWQGLFELIYRSDKFIFLDDFQFVIQSHHTRNKLFVGENKIDYYNVPIQKIKSFEAPLNQALIVQDPHWKKKILRTLEYNYKKTPYFKEIHSIIENSITGGYSNLAELNIKIIQDVCNLLGIKKVFLKSSDFTKELNTTSKRSKRVEELLTWSGASGYLCAFGSYDYMIEDGFNFEKYPTLFQNYLPKPYPQIHSNNFVPYLSVLDALYNIGSLETLKLIKNGTEKWLTKEERGKLNG